MGNICRSPTAEAIFRQRALRAGLNLTVDSAGTHSYHIGEPPDPRSQRYAKQFGYDLSALRARQIEVHDFEKFDLILVMDHQNEIRVREICPPHQKGKVKRFLEFSNKSNDKDVPDPYYGTQDDFLLVIRLIEEASDGLIDHLQSANIP